MTVSLEVYDYDSDGNKIVVHDATMGFSRIIGYITIGGSDNYQGSFTVPSNQMTGTLFAYFQNNESPSRYVNNRYNRGYIKIVGNIISWFEIGDQIRLYYGVST